jgi:hypothetical protein
MVRVIAAVASLSNGSLINSIKDLNGITNA